MSDTYLIRDGKQFVKSFNRATRLVLFTKDDLEAKEFLTFRRASSWLRAHAEQGLTSSAMVVVARR